MFQAAPPRIRVGCQTRTYAAPPNSREQLLAILDQITEAGYTGFETNYINLQSFFDDPAPMRAEFARRRLHLIGIHVGIRFNQPDSLVQGRELFEKVARGTKALGGSYVMVSGSAGAVHNFDRKAEFLARAGRTAHESGIALAVHNHVEEAQNDWAEFRHLLSHSDPGDVSLVVDIGHSTRAGADHAAFIRRYHPRIRAFHLKDWNSAGQTRLGEGKVNLPAFAQVIRETLWSGWLTAELEGVLPLGLTAHENALHARRYIREKMEP